MASIISASTTSATALNLSGDTSGVLQIATGATPTTAITVDASQNVGIGTGTYASTAKTIYVPNGGVISSDANNYTFAGNAKYDSAWKYINTDYATSYKQTGGQHQWNIASSGTAGNSITFTQAMTLDNSGNVTIGTTDPGTGSAAGKLTILPSSINLSAIRTSLNNASYANGATVDFSNKSGMLLVNNLTSGGIAIWIVGGGSVTAVSSVSSGTGSVAFTGGAYRWTSTSGATNTYSFTFIQTRDAV